MKFIYDIFFLIFGLFYIPGLIVKKKLHRGFLQKFGVLPPEVKGLDRPVWIHAVSVGEAALASKLAGRIRERLGNVPIVVSTTTQTGNDMVTGTGRGVVDAVFYYPMDISVVVSRVVDLVDPRLYVMMETELWPNLLEKFRLRKIPVVLANGRISDRSFANYSKIKFVTRRILRCINCFCMQTGEDAARIKKLGAVSNNIFVTGNIKFDEGEVPGEHFTFSRKCFGFDEDDDIIVAGSTHCPEETAIIDIFADLKRERKNLKLILAPRHIERIEAVEIYIEKSGFKYSRLSGILEDGDASDATHNTQRTTRNARRATHDAQRTTHDAKYDVLLVDTIGHLKDLYGIATIVFIGGSIAAKGGQNPIEAAHWGKITIFGPHMFNFREISEILLKTNSSIQVKDAGHLKEKIQELLSDPIKRGRMEINAGRTIEDNSGAVDRTAERIEKCLKQKI